MGGGNHGEFKIPDWRQYKVENAPELVQLQRALASQGLKDPWIRNEVWRYERKPGFKTPLQQASFLFFRGFKYGLALTVLTIAYDQVSKLTKSPVDHGHGHH
ncbi:NADH dehydrogenase [ubiquinone] 1 beta subcomplex subunit 3-like [Artemia franciscana]|uniref:NADH dehydrogenase [ubiquinone] 1 beta subcomplex subunit 3 n=1 Tax=Artemia franciscana TaxID=6661 RepID=A0AA88IC54_ARTSF|nr:hypothetical protein QYM36_000188 [Artemia franciscana]KAK2725600.1 hypothetical protein QYM36_000188 [Artemia franciscana]KAK2725601.1 hypothetical protein QYM36_000188 [Artemia franciscana]KAK2725602.1 hypothetical protein QYM36_000188 [Artemia franciscana]